MAPLGVNSSLFIGKDKSAASLLLTQDNRETHNMLNYDSSSLSFNFLYHVHSFATSDTFSVKTKPL